MHFNVMSNGNESIFPCLDHFADENPNGMQASALQSRAVLRARGKTCFSALPMTVTLHCRSQRGVGKVGAGDTA
jgi:hypothetical protein